MSFTDEYYNIGQVRLVNNYSFDEVGTCLLCLLSSRTILSYSLCLFPFLSLQVALPMDVFNKDWMSSCLFRGLNYSFLIPAPTCCFQIPIAFSFVFPAVASHQLCPCFHCHPQLLPHVHNLYCASLCKQQERGAAIR